MAELWTPEFDPISPVFDAMSERGESALWAAFEDEPMEAFEEVIKVSIRAVLSDPDDITDFAADWAEQNVGDLIKGINRQTQDAVQQIITRGIQRGSSNETMARAISKQVGLTPQMANAVENYRKQLVSSGYTRDEAERISGRYSDRLRKNRASMIAKTELQRALVAGQQEVWKQAAESGYFDPSTMRRRWVVHKDDRLCPVCKAMHKKSVPFYGSYRISKQAHPGPPLHPNCRCYEQLVDARGRIMKVEPAEVLEISKKRIYVPRHMRGGKWVKGFWRNDDRRRKKKDHEPGAARLMHTDPVLKVTGKGLTKKSQKKTILNTLGYEPAEDDWTDVHLYRDENAFFKDFYDEEDGWDLYEDFAALEVTNEKDELVAFVVFRPKEPEQIETLERGDVVPEGLTDEDLGYYPSLHYETKTVTPEALTSFESDPEQLLLRISQLPVGSFKKVRTFKSFEDFQKRRGNKDYAVEFRDNSGKSIVVGFQADGTSAVHMLERNTAYMDLSEALDLLDESYPQLVDHSGDYFNGKTAYLFENMDERSFRATVEALVEVQEYYPEYASTIQGLEWISDTALLIKGAAGWANPYGTMAFSTGVMKRYVEEEGNGNDSHRTAAARNDISANTKIRQLVFHEFFHIVQNGLYRKEDGPTGFSDWEPLWDKFGGHVAERGYGTFFLPIRQAMIMNGWDEEEILDYPDITPLSDYGNKHPVEYEAELFGAYIAYPELMKEKHPELYDYAVLLFEEGLPYLQDKHELERAKMSKKDSESDKPYRELNELDDYTLVDTFDTGKEPFYILNGKINGEAEAE